MKNCLRNITPFLLTLIGLFVLGHNTKAQKAVDSNAIINAIFPRGEKVLSSSNFNGTVWLNRFVTSSDSLNCIVSIVTFEPGVRTNWHTHAGGQILMVTEGTGYYQEKGKQIKILHKGDIVKCLPGVTHWHGATPHGEFAHLVVAPDLNKGDVIWLQKVTDEEYNGLK